MLSRQSSQSLLTIYTARHVVDSGFASRLTTNPIQKFQQEIRYSGDAAVATNLLERRQSAFVLWRVGNTNQPAVLIIGQLAPGAPMQFVGEQRFTLTPAAGFSDLFEIPAA